MSSYKFNCVFLIKETNAVTSQSYSIIFLWPDSFLHEDNSDSFSLVIISRITLSIKSFTDAGNLATSFSNDFQISRFNRISLIF